MNIMPYIDLLLTLGFFYLIFISMRRSYQTYKYNKIYDNFQDVKPQYEKAKKILDECREKRFKQQFAPLSAEEKRIIAKNRKSWREFDKFLSDIEKHKGDRKFWREFDKFLSDIEKKHKGK